MFDKERFVQDCRAALKERDAHAAVRELVRKAVSDPAGLMKAIGEPERAGVNTLYKADDLTILNLCWGPQMVFKPHDHRMWAVIGIYTGREENTFFRRDGEGLKRHSIKVLEPKDTSALGIPVIHAVTNPLDKITAALHVYGGDFFGTSRSEWDPKTHREQPYDVADTMRAFEASNDRLLRATTGR
ncbi:MAG TPA: cysteine dioxygenase family protein [Burkholderiales bacterium]|nr:cysteine dioxygenase family protein [Burkholderiales bacterium]